MGRSAQQTSLSTVINKNIHSPREQKLLVDEHLNLYTGYVRVFRDGLVAGERVCGDHPVDGLRRGSEAGGRGWTLHR